MSIGITGVVLLPLPLPQNGLATKITVTTHTLLSPHPLHSSSNVLIHSQGEICGNAQRFASNLIKYSYSLFSMVVGTQQIDTLDGEMESLQNLVWEWREEGGR